MLIEKPSGTYYKIEDAHSMRPFFINVVSSSDVWMFLSSNGALTAGRAHPGNSLFPYETDDRLHQATSTGPKTLIRLPDGRIWEPFNTGYDNPFNITRNLYKRVTGDAVEFEEINHDTGLIFSYRWETSEKYGAVRTAAISYADGPAADGKPCLIGQGPADIEILDGVENIMPYGIPGWLAQTSGCLTDAYKACERHGTRMALYSLTSLIADTPEPIEVLRANAAWHIGGGGAMCLSSEQIPQFAAGAAISNEENCAGRKGAFLLCKNIKLKPGGTHEWIIVMDAGLSQDAAAALAREINSGDEQALRAAVQEDIKKGTDELIKLVAAADGLQHTAERNTCIRHYMNVLNNNMRGGVFPGGYEYEPGLLRDFIDSRNRELAESTQGKQFLDAAGSISSIIDLHNAAFETGNPDIIRLCLEFLPLTFSRRHGDPSRPWNYFNIRVKDGDGNRIYGYEGNWRDIFQNWEAMTLSFPAYIAPVVTKFLNASTADGFNPYRITSDGIDWEVPEPENPWSGYGYWGDHQIVYLNRLLEWLPAYRPGDLERLMSSRIYTYADLPYEIVPYKKILENSKDTIYFNKEKHEKLLRRAARSGADGKLLRQAGGNNSGGNESSGGGNDSNSTPGSSGNDSNSTPGGGIYYASFFEKLLIPILAKLSGLVPGGGIWMNTNRPEWNDANNAIVGNGLSMVTVYQLNRHLHCCISLLMKYGTDKTIEMAGEVIQWCREISKALRALSNNTSGSKSARAYLDSAGEAFERYRNAVYADGFGGRGAINAGELIGFLGDAAAALLGTIMKNKRDDGMYHSYNLLTLTEDDLTISPMFLMLEGQSAVLGSGCLSAPEALALARATEKSSLMCPERGQFMLYPVKKLNTFMQRNIIPAQMAEKSALIKKLLQDKAGGLVLRDADGNIRFHDSIVQSSDLKARLEQLAGDDRYKSLAAGENPIIWEIYEEVFRHKEFTGRSGIMYKYEGIGSIYWHQNAKFQVSLMETLKSAIPVSRDTDGGEHRGRAAGYRQYCEGLCDAYYRLRSGFGFNKTARQWGAFPLEPYSHTPADMPAQQPGMTGQVKEDILTRMSELGVTAQDGILSFDPVLLRDTEFIREESVFDYIDADANKRALPLKAGSLAFTVCAVPVVYHMQNISDFPSLEQMLTGPPGGMVSVYGKGGDVIYESKSLSLDEETSSRIFLRDGSVDRIEVTPG